MFFDYNRKSVQVLLSFRSGAWRKYEGLREFYLSDERPLCKECNVEITTKHMFDECPKFANIRRDVKREAGLDLNETVMWAFDNHLTTELLRFCKVVSSYVHAIAGIKTS
jgi:hypothetical protein